MLTRINTYLQQGWQKLQTFQQKRSRRTPAGLCCIGFSAYEVHIAYIKGHHQEKEIMLCRSYPFDEKQNLEDLLTIIVKENHLEDMTCSWMLSPEHYQLIITDNLPVNPTEFQAAIRWKIKDLLQMPVADATIDSFPLPNKKGIQANQNIMVVATRESYLKKVSDKIIESGLSLQIIDIPELALRNITALYEQDEKSTALIYIKEKESLLIITCQKTLYFTRHLDFGLDSVSSEILPLINKFALDLQRSFDYYQSQWQQPAPARLLLASTKPISAELNQYLSQLSSTPIQFLDVTTTIPSKQKISVEQQGKSLFILGGALREEGEKNAAN